MKKVTIHTFKEKKEKGEKFACLTAYDYTHAQLVSQHEIELILVGDSLGMVVQGRDTTIPVTIADMVYHTEAVACGNKGSFLVADMPFMSYPDVSKAYENAARLMRAGADMVKVEGGRWLCPIIEALTERGIPVCAHLGLTPQSYSMLGGFKVQGCTQGSADRLLQDAMLLEKAGSYMVVLECIPSKLAKEVTNSLEIPTIGIGAGIDTDGQILVLYDILGIHSDKELPRFTRNFMQDAKGLHEAIALYAQAVKTRDFPLSDHIYKD